MRTYKAGNVGFVGIGFMLSNVRVALGTRTSTRPADLETLIEGQMVVQELEADAASAVLMRWHFSGLGWIGQVRPIGAHRNVGPHQRADSSICFDPTRTSRALASG
jgi:hypothetical protein